MADHTLAWAAGLFEGEGSFVQRGAPHLWTLCLSSTDEDVVRTFHRVVGIGKIYGPYGYNNGTGRRREHHKQYWKWAVSDRRGIEVLADTLGPYLLHRRWERMNECLDGIAQAPSVRAAHTYRRNANGYAVVLRGKP